MMVIIVGALLLFLYIRRDMLTVDWELAEQYYTVPENLYFQEIWAQNIYTDCRCIITTNDSIYFVGTLQNRGLMSLIRLDLFTGEAQWQTTLPSAEAGLLTHNSQYILLSTTGGKVASPSQAWDTARIIAYDKFSGDQVWSQRIPGTYGVGTAYIIDERVYVLGGYDRTFQLAIETGEILNETKQRVLASQDEQANYFLEFKGIRAVNVKTGETLWFQETPVFPPPQFVGEIIIAGGNRLNLLGRAIALERRTGTVLWQYDNVVSNVAVNNSTVFFLQMDEDAVWDSRYVSDVYLLAVDMKTGSTVASMQFDPPGLTFGNRSFQYDVAVHDNIVLVYLSDGRQLIALRFLPDK
jgi:outer membrane protein assembly factor BamB